MSQPAGQELRSTNRPIYGAASISTSNITYIYGGFYNTPPWNKEALWTLSHSNQKLQQLPTNPKLSPAVIYHTLEAFNNTLFSFGGHDISIPPNTTEPLRYYALDLKRLVWTPLQKPIKNATGPLERYWHTTVSINSTVYLMGGMNMTHPQLDIWKYDTELDRWSLLMMNNSASNRCGHTSTMLNDGRIITLGGFDCSNKDRPLYSLNKASIYDTVSSQWYEQDLNGQVPKARTWHTAVKTNDNRIIICGGQDGKHEPFQTYISSTEDDASLLAALDLQSWQWQIPDIASPYRPFPRSFAIANIVNDTKMVYGLGQNYHSVYDGFYIFDLELNKWLPPSDIDKNALDMNNEAHVGLTIGLLVLGVVVALVSGYWLYKKYGILLQDTIKRSIWHPRAGEPRWAEISRLLFRLLFLAVFITISTVLVLQVQNSPVIDQQYDAYQPDFSLVAPDIRFCFDGWTNPIIHCTTDFGQPCNKFITNITEAIQSNVNFYHYPLVCYLFRAPTLKLGRKQDRIAYNGTLIKFHFYDIESLSFNNNSIVHIEFYHTEHNPNIALYSDNITEGFDGWYTSDESAQFQSSEQLNLKTRNLFDVKDYSASIGYILMERQTISSIWNYIGFFGDSSSGNQTQKSICTQYIQNNNNISDTSLGTRVGSVEVVPLQYSTKVTREHRAFTLVNGMGILGGIVGLIVGCQACLFGYRPRSPWGIVHRCSTGWMRQSLLRGLRARVPGAAEEVRVVPMVHPVHRRFSEAVVKFHDHAIQGEEEEEDDTSRMKKLEERLHVFELLFQAYYIDDEVFRSLHRAME